jgi:hypothetical protein
MNAKAWAFVMIGAGIVIWGANQIFTQPDGTQPLGIIGNALGTLLFIFGIVEIVRVYRKKRSDKAN